MAWGQVISWGGDETSDKWCDSMASLLIGTLNGKFSGNDKVMYLNKLGDVLRQHDSHNSLATISHFANSNLELKAGVQSLCPGLDLGNSMEGAVLVQHLCVVSH